MNQADEKRKLRNLRANMTRHNNDRGPATLRYCSGGPFDGREIALRTDSTAFLIINGWRGRYSAEKHNYVYDRRKVVWCAA